MSERTWNDPEVSSYMRGWICGASILSVPPDCDEHFSRGWRDGRMARRAAIERECERVGADPPGIIRLAGELTDI